MSTTAQPTITYGQYTFKPYISNEEIQQRIADIGARISMEYDGRRPLLVCVLNGAFPFAADLFRRIEGDAEIAFIRLSSYQGIGSTGVVKKIMGLDPDEVKGRDVIVVEDIVDTGTTISHLLDDLKAMEPASVKVATLLFKPEALVKDVTPDYVGFSIPKKFIIGFGLDLDGLARNLPDIWTVAD